ncbi:hypothetical protein [Lacticaseibacillus paracasei]|jgi:hypothetical protein|uniref:hypothetical protein n=1 Tax=Lacticaseibacillus paracasei TaxID=1597 RepID=UPI001371A0F7|nr:hypothetical protein [Lacticaseibacillus paracasei]MBM6413522.1 hypothetical protein [Lacticaseibacillus paracasei]MXI83362.1 hypothetical protein [Lacticaseibacillus paracasei]WNX22529.1 hypothetical protein RWA18_03120 [Lacticaseibacillus paracasei]
MRKPVAIKMIKEAFHRDRIALVVSFLIGAGAILFQLCPRKINNYTDVMSASLSFSSIATAFLFAVFSIIPGKTSSELLIKLREMNTDLKLMSRLLVATAAFFSSSVLSFAELFFNVKDTSWLSIIITSVWLLTIALGIIETIILIFFLFLVLGNMFQER